MEKCQPDLINKINAIKILSILSNQHSRRRKLAAALFPMAFVKGKRGFCMHFNDGILEFGFDCKARKLSDKSISNYQKQLRYLLRYLEAEFKVNQVEAIITPGEYTPEISAA